MRISAASRVIALASILTVLAGCAKRGDVDSAGQGIIQFRSACPTVAIPTHAGNVTLFDPADARTSDAIDVTATITDLKPNCTTQGNQIYTQVNFLVYGLRRDPGPARTVELPYFATVVRGGTAVVSKRVATVQLQFPEGGLRAVATGSAAAYVDRSAAELPSDIERMINRPRKSGDADAALDPLARPEVKEAVRRSSFELLIGFNLTQDQLKYNITR